MPTVLRIEGFRFFFFSLDRQEPAHVHVEHSERYAKFWLHPVALAQSRGFRSNELTWIRKAIEANRALLEEKWNEHFRDQG